jgi:transcriptional regulator with GAF, ATPase, and Fis domain
MQDGHSPLTYDGSSCMNEEIAKLKQRVQELEDLNKLAQMLSQTLEVEQTLQAVLNCSMKLCKAERGSIVLFGPGPENEVHTIMRNGSEVPESIDHQLNMLVAGCLRRAQKPFISQDILKSFEYTHPSDRVRGHGAALAVPLLTDGKMLGMIHHVNSRDGEPFTADAIRVSEVVANMASQFIVRAKLHESVCDNLKQLKLSLAGEQGVRSFIGKSEPMQKVFRDIALVAPTSATVLIIGETGTGKELTARAIHFQSSRVPKPFIAVNCAAIPADLFESELFGHERGAFTGASTLLRGKFELADGGTLFLDEISEMPIALQPKLLRVLEEKKFARIGSPDEMQVDVRVIAASSKDLEQAVRQGEFRDALFHRLNVVPIILPPLRDRRSDIPLLAQEMMREISGGVKHFEPDALELLRVRDWKGNVRELRNVVERVSIFVPNNRISALNIRGIGIEADHKSSGHVSSFLRELLSSSEKYANLPDQLEKELIRLALLECSGNISEAARMIGLDRKALQRRIEKFELM